MEKTCYQTCHVLIQQTYKLIQQTSYRFMLFFQHISLPSSQTDQNTPVLVNKRMCKIVC